MNEVFHSEPPERKQADYYETDHDPLWIDPAERKPLDDYDTDMVEIFFPEPPEGQPADYYQRLMDQIFITYPPDPQERKRIDPYLFSTDKPRRSPRRRIRRKQSVSSPLLPIMMNHGDQ